MAGLAAGGGPTERGKERDIGRDRERDQERDREEVGAAARSGRLAGGRLAGDGTWVGGGDPGPRSKWGREKWREGKRERE